MTLDLLRPSKELPVNATHSPGFPSGEERITAKPGGESNAKAQLILADEDDGGRLRAQ